MSEESASNPSIWASMSSWFTPTVLFVLLNLVIGTIIFTSSLSNQEQQEIQDEKAHHQDDEKSHHQDDPQKPKLAQSPSVLQRLKSINLHNFRSQESPPMSSLLKQTPDSNSHYDPHQEKQELHTLETHARYIFEETHQHETISTETQFLFQPTHQENVPNSQTQFVFEQIHKENVPNSTTQFVFETHEENVANSPTQFVFEQTHEAKTINTETHYDPDEINEQDDEDGQPKRLDEFYSQLAQLTDRYVSRTKSDTKPASGEVPPKLPQKMKKSASLKSAFGHFEESDIVESRRPATVRERSGKVTEGDNEVDAKADDFINKFKQQLKLQRMDSIMRYKEVISRASAK